MELDATETLLTAKRPTKQQKVAMDSNVYTSFRSFFTFGLVGNVRVLGAVALAVTFRLSTLRVRLASESLAKLKAEIWGDLGKGLALRRRGICGAATLDRP